MTRILSFLGVLGVLGGFFTSAASAQDSSALINKQLDALIKLDLKTTLPEAMKQIAKETGVRLEATPAVWELLPYGRETPISAKLENLTLREGLMELTKALGLKIELKPEAVEIQPMPALQRLGRRATVEELRTLLALAATPLDAEIGATGISAANLLAAADERAGKLKPVVAFENRAGDIAASQTIGVARGVSFR